MTASAKRAGWEDLLLLGEDRYHEVLGGQLVQKASPTAGHGRVQASLGASIGGPFDFGDGGGRPGGWWILSEVEVLLSPKNIVRPDLAGWRRQRLARPDAEYPVRVLPDWICEIVSPSDARRDRVVKAALYAEHGVPHYWIVSPEDHVVEAFALGPEGDAQPRQWVRLGAWSDGDLARIQPFDAVELDVGRWFFPRD